LNLLEERRRQQSAETIGIMNGERMGFESDRGIFLAGLAKDGDDIG
jgi:hypothetical protein